MTITATDSRWTYTGNGTIRSGRKTTRLDWSPL
jgi:hypothetical protein